MIKYCLIIFICIHFTKTLDDFRYRKIIIRFLTKMFKVRICLKLIEKKYIYTLVRYKTSQYFAQNDNSFILSKVPSG